MLLPSADLLQKVTFSNTYFRNSIRGPNNLTLSKQWKTLSDTAFDLVLYCLSMTQQNDAMLKWVNSHVLINTTHDQQENARAVNAWLFYLMYTVSPSQK